MNKPQYMTWREVVAESIEDTKFAYGKQSVEKDEFLATFQEFYEERIAECRITMWPIDPSSSHRMAESRAESVYDDL